MDFSYGDRLEELLGRVRSFMDEHVYPVEAEAMAALDDEVKPGVAYPEIIVGIRERARAEGLWNMFMPGDEHGTGLTNSKTNQAASRAYSADYSANRSVHLPWGSWGFTRNRTISHEIRSQNTSDELFSLAPNPFQPLFSGPNAKFNEPDSIYNNPTIPLLNLLRPYPQFDGEFTGLPLLSQSRGTTRFN